MNKYFDTLTNVSGDSLPSYRAQVFDSAGSIVTIYKDNGGTRFTDAAGGNVNYATADEAGRVEFYWTAATGQVLQVLDSAGDLVYPIADFANNFVTTQDAVGVILGVDVADTDMGTYTGSTITDDGTAKENIQELETAVETKTTASTLAGTGGAGTVGTASGSDVETDLQTKSRASAMGITSTADNFGTFTGTTFTDNQTAKQLLQATETEIEGIKTLTPTNEGTALALATALTPIPSGPRDAIQYQSATTVSFTRKTATMGGFRFKGQYQKTGRQPSFPINGNTANVSTMQAAMSAVKSNAWYGIFVVADNGDSQAEIKVMPFLRLAVPVGSVANIIEGGENVTDLTATASHSWTATDNLAGTDCLVIHENKIFSGRTTTFTANTATSVTLDTIGSIAAGDFVLPAPPGYDHYCYIGSFYRDAAEVRNIADNGVGVSSRAVNHSSATGSGTVTTYEEIDWRGYICPLATGIVINVTQTLNTASTGELLQRLSIDSSNHDIWEKYETKEGSPVKRCWEPRIDIDFGQSSSTWYQNAGSLTAQTTSRQFEIRGWKEP